MNEPIIQVCLKINEGENKNKKIEIFDMNYDKFRVLFHELKIAYNQIKKNKL